MKRHQHPAVQKAVCLMLAGSLCLGTAIAVLPQASASLNIKDMVEDAQQHSELSDAFLTFVLTVNSDMDHKLLNEVMDAFSYEEMQDILDRHDTAAIERVIEDTRDKLENGDPEENTVKEPLPDNRVENKGNGLLHVTDKSVSYDIKLSGYQGVEERTFTIRTSTSKVQLYHVSTGSSLEVSNFSLNSSESYFTPFILLNEYTASGDTLTLNQKFSFVQLAEDGKLLSPGAPMLAPTLPVINEAPAKVVFGDNLCTNMMWNQTETITLRPGQYYLLSISDKWAAGGDGSEVKIWFAIGGSAPSNTLTAQPTASEVTVNGAPKVFEAYLIEGNNYFKLRDLAYVLNGTEKQFSVSWDAASSTISLTSQSPYTPAGGELSAGAGKSQAALKSTAKLMIDGTMQELTAYTIGGNNYFKLRDLGKVFDFGVGWDSASSTVSIDSSASYTE